MRLSNLRLSNGKPEITVGYPQGTDDPNNIIVQRRLVMIAGERSCTWRPAPDTKAPSVKSVGFIGYDLLERGQVRAFAVSNAVLLSSLLASEGFDADVIYHSCMLTTLKRLCGKKAQALQQ